MPRLPVPHVADDAAVDGRLAAGAGAGGRGRHAIDHDGEQALAAGLRRGRRHLRLFARRRRVLVRIPVREPEDHPRPAEPRAPQGQQGRLHDGADRQPVQDRRQPPGDEQLWLRIELRHQALNETPITLLRCSTHCPEILLSEPPLSFDR